MSQDPGSGYNFAQEGGDYVFTWNGGAVEIRLSHISEGRGETSAEIKVSSNLPPHPGCLEWGRVNLSAISTRASLAKSLSARLPFDWQGALLQVAHKAVECLRQGEPTVDLRAVPARTSRWLLWPFVEYGGPTILFADGGTGKSVLALMMAYSVAAAKPLLGRPQVGPTKVLYLDWEADAYTHAERLRAVHDAYAFGTSCPAVAYKRMVGSLADAANELRTEIARDDIGFVVVDSLSLAVGSGMPLEDSSTATAFFGALRSLNVPPLVIAHVSKATVGGNGNQKATPFGSIFFRNMTRLAWYVESLQEEGQDETLLRFEHVKSNNGRYEKQRGYRLSFDNVGPAGDESLAGIRIKPIELTDVPKFAQKLTWAQRITPILAHGPMSVADIAEALGEENRDLVSTHLNQLQRQHRVQHLSGHRWALAAPDPGF